MLEVSSDLFSFLFFISDVDLPAIVGARDQLEVVKGPSNASHLEIFFVFVFVCDGDGEDDDWEDIQMVFISVTQATFFCAFIQFPYLSNLLN